MRTMPAGRLCLVAVTLAVFLAGPKALAHSIHYELQQKGISAKIFYAAKDPASYSEYEVYGPSDNQPYQIGRTDRAGVLSFLPDRPGLWKIKVLGESAHGFHGVTTEIKVDQDLHLESFRKPLAAAYTKLVTGISLIIGLFGIYALILSRKKLKKGTPTTVR